jgi:UTP-glucose-1-phosphate uridylyltransferase
MTRSRPIQVIVAAGGLGTRVQPWSTFLPKEFTPVAGRPGLVHLLDEIAACGPAHVVIVYHPYYEPFIRWARTVLAPGATAGYRHAARLPPAPAPAREDLCVTFVRQHGRYADVTSVLNGADHLHAGPVYVAFADNLYPAANPLLALTAAPAGDAVLARPYDPTEAGHRGVLVVTQVGDRHVIADLVEKPHPGGARDLYDRHGPDHLRLLEGRMRLTAGLVDHLARLRLPEGSEPKLALALRGYARTHPVTVITTRSSVIDLGTGPDTAVPQQPLASTSR